MTTATILLDMVMLLALLLSIKPLGLYIAKVMSGENRLASRIGGRLETFVYRAAGIDARHEMNWKDYAIALLLFSVCGALIVYLLQRVQVWLPLNPQAFANVTPDSSF